MNLFVYFDFYELYDRRECYETGAEIIFLWVILGIFRKNDISGFKYDMIFKETLAMIKSRHESSCKKY